MYFKEDSVSLALSILDEYELRLGDSSSVMRLSKADFSHKNAGGGTHAEAKPRKTVDRKKASQRIGKMQKYVSFFPLQSPIRTQALKKTTRVG